MCQAVQISRANMQANCTFIPVNTNSCRIIYARRGCVYCMWGSFFLVPWPWMVWCSAPPGLLPCYRSGHPLSLSCECFVAAVKSNPASQKCVFYVVGVEKNACASLVGLFFVSELHDRVSFTRIHDPHCPEFHSRKIYTGTSH